ncbi:carboxypeptidase-like regulatory domain-containing protein, partial [Algoriphagus sp. D3-2-R+10]|uniref:carboxypeptidase-like regulatory domain-containing protein n=1 Tax=Algoriphagus aurantiacus TaxID=3103948 RepID=UPI002B3F6A63
MKNYIIKLVLGCLLIFSQQALYAQQESLISGEVRSAADSEPLPGASVMIKGSTQGTITDTDGKFTLSASRDSTYLMVSYLGFISQEREINLNQSDGLVFYLEPDQLILGEVEVVSTGYQEIPRERASGSFVQLGQEMVNR